MKTTTIILAAVLSLQINVLFAGNEHSPANVNSTREETTLNVSALFPDTPAEATFEDVCMVCLDIEALAPEVPAEADFSDVAPATGIDLLFLAPATPDKADFSDVADQDIDIRALAPVTPAFADFE